MQNWRVYMPSPSADSLASCSPAALPSPLPAFSTATLSKGTKQGCRLISTSTQRRACCLPRDAFHSCPTA
eukprot:3403365-Pleurochrysis_carterae.AAC.1